MHDTPHSCHPRRGRLAAGVVLAATLLAACNGDDPPSASTPSDTTAASTTTTTSSTTSTTTTSTTPSTSSTTTTTTTVAPPTTPTSIDFAELEVVLPPALDRFVEVSNTAFGDPANAELREALRTVAAATALERLNAQLDSFVESGYFSEPNPAQPSRIDADILSISTAPGTNEIGIDGCLVDTEVVLQRGENGEATVVQAEPDSYRVIFTMGPTAAGTWVVRNLVVDQTFSGQIGCE